MSELGFEPRFTPAYPGGPHILLLGSALLQRLGERPQRPTPMTYRILLLGRRLAEGLAELVAPEERIVAEPRGATRRLQNVPLQDPSKTRGTASELSRKTRTQR